MLNRGHVLGTAAVLALPISFYAPKGIAPLFAVTAIATVAIYVVRARAFPRLARGPAFALGALVLWAALSALWSLTPFDSLDAATSLAVASFAGLAFVAASAGLTARERDVYEKAVIAGGVLGFALLAVELVTDVALYRWVLAQAGYPVHSPVLLGVAFTFDNGLTMAALLMWTWALALFNRGLRVLAVAYFFFAVAVMVLAGKGAPLIAIAFGGTAFVAALVTQRLAATALAAVIALGVLAVPLMTKAIPPIDEVVRSAPSLLPSAYIRLYIWRNAGIHIDERWLLGHGMDTSRALYDADDRTARTYYDGEGRPVWDTGQEPIPLHPHNAAVQVWLELGVVGAAALALVLVTAVRAVAASAVARTDKAVWLAVFVTGFTIASLSYGIWQGWWLGALWLVAAFAVAAARPRLPT